jgi:hypothetical protein
MTEEEYTEAYSAVCDVIERNYHDWDLEPSEENPFSHTSKEARAAALKIFEILGISYE